MPPFAVISDIHANLAALRSVLLDIEGQGLDRILCLGDIVGYGPDPAECVQLVRQRCALCLKGNHDVAATTEPLGFNQAARQAALWTKKRLVPGWFSGPTRRANWQWILSLPDRHSEERRLFVHGSPRDPVMEYVEESDLFENDLTSGRPEPSAKIQHIFSYILGTCFIGHTHRPGVIDEAYAWHSPHALDFVWRGAGKALINVGSVGQPRDGDPRASYVVVDGPEVRFRRVEYDIDETIEKIRGISWLHDQLAERLTEGR